MPIQDTERFLKVARELATLAEPMFRKHFGNPSRVHEKKQHDFVTDTDREIETLIVSRLKKEFPDHGIVGEEFSPHETSEKEYTWYVDPIDGTTLYIHGIPFCCISIGLADAKGPLVGVISNPMMGEVFTAVRGGGAFKNGERISVSTSADVSASLGAIAWGSKADALALLSGLIPHIGKIRVFGSSAYQLCLVADGRLDFLLAGGLHAWDIGAGAVIASEAGATISDLTGNPFTLSAPEKMLCTNGALHKEFLTALQNASL